MEYKVVPFVASINQQKENSSVVAKQLEDLINYHLGLGWKYLRLESVSTYIQPNNGCFGVGGKPGFISSYQMVVFVKDEISLNVSN